MSSLLKNFNICMSRSKNDLKEYFQNESYMKSVQSILSHLQSPPWANAVPAQLWLFLVKITFSWHDLVNNARPKLPKK